MKLFTNKNYYKKSDLPRFQEFMLNEIYNISGCAEDICLEERLILAYQIIKKHESIYKRFKDNNFFQAFVMVSKSLVFSTDKADLIDLIDFSYIVLNDKEEVKEDYFAIKREIEATKVSENKKVKI